jgi:glycosyltransferase involved in cell wall biosynthesis
MKLLYFSKMTRGGLAEYAFHQANALVEEGAELIFLCPEDLAPRQGEKFSRTPSLRSNKIKAGNKLSKLFGHISVLRFNIRKLVETAMAEKVDAVLFSSYFESFSPLWAGLVVPLRKAGITVGSVVHDPIRDAWVGPGWWHRLSIAKAYSFVDVPFMHELGEIDTGGRKLDLKPIKIPHGPYPIATNNPGRDEARNLLGLPLEVTVFLAFGHIRDNKNLDLCIQALAKHKEAWLIVAGSILSASQKPVSFYKELAEKTGVADRVVWHTDYIPNGAMGIYFAASDCLCLTYSSGFRSASGVLGLAVNFRKPCIASSGVGPLKSVIEKYRIGIWLEPDSLPEVEKGMKQFMHHPPALEWGRYEDENSWATNARTVIKHLRKT